MTTALRNRAVELLQCFRVSEIPHLITADSECGSQSHNTTQYNKARGAVDIRHPSPHHTASHSRQTGPSHFLLLLPYRKGIGVLE
ncbi:hypothetical protein PoB_002947100, partial [Plakobranchus ocellatus]